MQKTLSTRAYAKRVNGFRPVGKFIGKSAQKVSSKRGFHDQFLIAHWKEVVGSELGAITRPYQMKPTRAGGATLILECASGYVPELTMRTDEMRIKINTALGGNAIEKIVLRHHVTGFSENKRPEQRPIFLEREIPNDIERQAQNAKSTELQMALRDMSKAFYNRGNTNE